MLRPTPVRLAGRKPRQGDAPSTAEATPAQVAAVEAARAAAEYNMPDAVAARELQSATDALAAQLERARKVTGEAAVESFRWAGCARRAKLLGEHGKQLAALKEVAARATAAGVAGDARTVAAGVAGKTLGEATRQMAVMEATRRQMYALAA